MGLTIYFAAAILFNGVAGIVFALGNRTHLRGWDWLLALGLAEVIFGFYLLSAPIAAAGILVFFIGFWLLLRSGAIITNAFVLRRLGYRRWGWTLAMGLAGFLVLANPAIGVLGVAAAVLGLLLRRVAHPA